MYTFIIINSIILKALNCLNLIPIEWKQNKKKNCKQKINNKSWTFIYLCICKINTILTYNIFIYAAILFNVVIHGDTMRILELCFEFYYKVRMRSIIIMNYEIQILNHSFNFK